MKLSRVAFWFGVINIICAVIILLALASVIPIVGGMNAAHYFASKLIPYFFLGLILGAAGIFVYIITEER